MTEDKTGESFEEFKSSFNYGRRSDLNFKFLKGFSDEEAARFFQDLLWQLGDTLDDGNFGRIIDHIYQAQIHGYAGAGKYVYEDGPFSKLPRPLSQSRLALFTSSGHFVEGDDPKPFGVEHMTQQEAEARIVDFIKNEPQLSVIPIDTPESELRVRHGGYDIRGALADPNVNFPLTRLKELQQAGRIGELAANAYSFLGACSQLRLLNHTGPAWVEMIKAQHIDAVLLVPV